MKITTIGIDLAGSVSGSRCGCARQSHAAQATAPERDGKVFRQSGTLPDWYGSMR